MVGSPVEFLIAFNALVAATMVAAFTMFMQIRRSGDHTAMLVDSINTPGHGLLFFDAKGKFQFANRPAALYLPFLQEGADKTGRPRTLSDFLNYMFDHAVDMDESLHKALDKTVSNLMQEGFREVIRWDEDKLCLVELQKTPAGRRILVLRDVSEKKRQEEHLIRLGRSNYEITQAIEASTNGIVICAARSVRSPVAFANLAFCEQMGMSPQDVINCNLPELLRKCISHEAADAVAATMDEGRAGDFEIKTGSAGSERWFNLKITPVSGMAGKIGLFIAVFSETTALKIREAEFFQAQKLEALGQLAAGVAHDFNNILSIIDGYARLAGQKLEPGHAAADYLDKISMAAARGAHLTRQMLTFSRHKILSQDVVDLSETVREQEALMRPLVDASVSLFFRYAPGAMPVESPPDSLMQILMNFVINARDSMPRGGSLIIETRFYKNAELPPHIRAKMPPGDCACLQVTDTGAGMTREVIERIFDPFFTTKGQGRGTGLGLSVVYGLVRQLGGQIDVISAPGGGTTMAVFLPLSIKKPQKKISGSPLAIADIRLEGYTALVCEDEPDLLAIVREMLEKLGLKVLSAKSGDEALLVHDSYEEKIDLLLTDVVMPNLNGVDLAEMLCEIQPGLKVLFMSGYPAGGDSARVQLPQGALFMAKPIAYDALARQIFMMLTNKSQSEKNVMAARWESSEAAIKKKGTAG